MNIVVGVGASYGRKMMANLANINRTAIVSVIVKFVNRSYVSTKLTKIEGERILFAGKTPCLRMHLTMGTSYVGIKMKNPLRVQ